MTSINEAIRNTIAKSSKGYKDSDEKFQNTSGLIIEQKLNKLFTLPPNPDEELEMIRMQYDQKKGDRYGLHASAIIVGDDRFCYREQVLSLFYKQNQGANISIGLKRIFEEGNYIHEKWQRLFIRGGYGIAKCMDRSRFCEEYDLSYTPDICPAKILPGKKHVVEIKSVNTFQFKHMKSHPSGKKQLMFYNFLTGLNDGFVLAEDKNTQEFKVFPYEYDAVIVEPFVVRLENIQKYKKRFKKSKIMEDGICKNCQTKRALECGMRDACFNIGIGRVKLEI